MSGTNLFLLPFPKTKYASGFVTMRRVYGHGRRPLVLSGASMGRNKLVPDIYTREKLALEHRHQLLREAEQERKLAGVQNAISHSKLLIRPDDGAALARSAFPVGIRSLKSLVGRLGIGLGTRLQRRDQGDQPGE